MKYKALISFTGATLSAYAGQEIEIGDKSLAKELLKIGYIEETEQEKPKKRGKKDED